MEPNLPKDETMSDGDDSGVEEISEQETVTLPVEHFPTTPAEGDKITFCVTGIGEDGNVQGYFETAEEIEPESDENYGEEMKTAMKAAGV